MKRVMLALLYATSIWSAMYLYSSVFGKKTTSVHSSSVHFDYSFERNTIFGWPIVERIEKYHEYRHFGWKTTLTNKKTARVEHNAISFDDGKVQGDNLLGTNFFWWIVIASLTGFRVYRKHSQTGIIQYRLESIFFSIMVVAVFLKLSELEFFGWSWLLLFPISFGVTCCMIEASRLSFVFASVCVAGTRKREKKGTQLIAERKKEKKGDAAH